MKILSKKSWESLGIISFAYIFLLSILVGFEIATLQEAVYTLTIVVFTAFSALKINEICPK